MRASTVLTVGGSVGEDGAPIYIGLLGTVFDVSKGASFYGKGGAYHVFAGRDATVGLAKVR